MKKTILTFGLLLLLGGLGLSPVGRSFAAQWVGPDAGRAVLQTVEQQLFEAVRQHLTAANLAPSDLPTKLLAVVPTGNKRYRVHTAMGVGDAWFEVWWEGGQWQVRGIQPPQ
ncbi:MAG: hypothetical protein ACM3XM_12840 [Mycobacterium leprae]